MHWLKLDSVEKESLFGHSNEKTWNKGIIEQLLDAIKFEKDLAISQINFQKKEIPKYEYFTFSSEIVNKEFIEKKCSDDDWLAVDNGFLGNYYGHFIEMLINRKIFQENGNKLVMSPAISQFYEVFYFLLKK